MRVWEPVGPGLWGRRIGLGGVVAVVVGLLMILPSAANATPALTAPYTGYVYATQGANLGGCGGNATWPGTPFFNLTNGHAHISAGAKAPACAKTTASVDTYAEAEFQSSAFTLTAGHHTVKEKWWASYSIDLVATPGPGGQTAVASSQLYATAYIYDATNHTDIYATHEVYLDNSTSSGSLVKSFSGVKLTSYVNGTFASGHSYEIIVYLVVYADVNVSAGKSTASAQINCGTSGKFATLISITAT
ncbi:MAG: hypothetical protein L3K02_09190 [Thermoplasmata archaeon]|nr:hypothetical protein [Thermoplasmata archaeon]